MQSLLPEQALLICTVTGLPTLKKEQAVTRSVIEAIPLDKGDYRPEPIAKSALELAWHIVASEHRFLGGIAAGAFDFTANPRPENVKTSADIAKWYGESFEKNLAAISKLSGEELTKPLDFRGMFQMPAVLFLGMSNNHSIHHRGQLSTYLRPMGGKVPAIYGESYDSAAARKAAGG
jgi:uncharacterized damage-inducible protein DinB